MALAGAEPTHTSTDLIIQQTSGQAKVKKWKEIMKRKRKRENKRLKKISDRMFYLSLYCDARLTGCLIHMCANLLPNQRNPSNSMIVIFIIKPNDRTDGGLIIN